MPELKLWQFQGEERSRFTDRPDPASFTAVVMAACACFWASPAMYWIL